jgi:hypothetical protein
MSKSKTPESLVSSVSQTAETLHLRKLTLADVPYTLPIGIFSPEGERLQSYTLKPYEGHLERTLSRLCEKKQNRPNRTTEIMTAFLPLILDEINGKSFSQLSSDFNISPQDMIQNMYLADAIHILFQLRIDEYEQFIRLSAECPKCGTKYQDEETEPSNLTTVDVNSVQSLISPLFEYTLKNPVIFYPGTDNEEVVTTLNIRPVRVRDLERLNKPQTGDDALSLKHRILFSTLVGSEKNTGDEYRTDKTLPIISVESLYDRMRTKDRADLMKAVQKIGDIGPSVQTDVCCQNPACGNKFSAAIPWQDLGSFLSGIV